MNMSRQGDFLIYCTEQYKSSKNLTGKQVAELFTRFRVWDYIYSCFEALHTTGGPLSNLLLSFAALLVFSLVCAFLRVPYAIDGDTAFGGKLLYFLTELLWYFHILNLYLAVFNLIPIPPLDGSKVLFMFLPAKIYFFVSKYERYISLALLALLYLGVLSTPIAWICSYISYGMSLLIGLIPGV